MGTLRILPPPPTRPITSPTMIAKKYPDDDLVFANGGDRVSTKTIPETPICEKYDIGTVFGVGTAVRGLVKPDSSTRINKALGREE